MTLETRERSLAENGTHTAVTNPILVFGMHRGGTSALAGLLHLSGFDLGPALMEPAEGVNDRGFWEHLDAYRIHERLLASLGRSRFDPREMPAGWREHPAFHIAVDEVRDLVRRDFGEARYWAVKDPRMCRIAPVWLEALASLDIAPRVILIVRHPAEVARSMQAQRWIASTARAHLCWLQHILEAEEATRGVPRSLITYDALLADWRSERERISRDLELEWPALVADGAAAIDAFLDPRERRFQETEAVVAPGTTRVPALAAELFDAAISRDEHVWQRIADIGDTFRRGAAAFGPCLDEAIVEASLAFIEVGQGRIDAAARADHIAEVAAGIAAEIGGSLDARLRPLGELIAQTTTRLETIDTHLHELSQRFASHEARAAKESTSEALSADARALLDRVGMLAAKSAVLEQELSALGSTVGDLPQRHADELRSLREALATAIEELGKVR